MYIRLQELEFLLSHYKELQGLIQELNIEIKAVREERPGDDDEIYARVTRRNVDGMPFSTHMVSDRTAMAVINRSDTRQLRKAVKEVQTEILTIEIVLFKIELGLRRLNTQCRAVIEKKYFMGMTLKEVSQEMEVDIKTVGRYRNLALNKMMQVSKISLVEQLKLRTLLELIKNN